MGKSSKSIELPTRQPREAQRRSGTLAENVKSYLLGLNPIDMVHPPVWAISIEDGEARVLLVRGQEVVTWGMVRVDASPEESSDSPTSAGTSQIRHLLQTLRAQNGRFVIDLPLQAPLMRRLELPEIKRRYRAQVVLSELRDALPFAPDEVDVAWRSQRGRSGHRVFSIATPKRVLDERVRLLRQAGARVSSAYAKATALAFVVGVPNVIVVHLEAAQAEVVLVQDGAPILVHRAPLGSPGVGPQAQVEAVLRAISQVAGYQESPPGAIGLPSIPVAVTGQHSLETSVVSALKARGQREVVPVPERFRAPPHFPSGEYAINLGLVLADRARGKTGTEARPDRAIPLNLLPERLVSHRVPIRPLAVFSSILLLAATSLSVAPLVDAKAIEVTRLTVEMDRLERLERQHRLDQMRTAAVAKNFDAATVMVETLESHQGELKKGFDSLVARLEAVHAAPPGVTLSSLMVEDWSFELSGVASSYGGVLQYTAALRASGLFTGVKITRLEGSAANVEGEPSTLTPSPSLAFQIKAMLPEPRIAATPTPPRR